MQKLCNTYVSIRYGKHGSYYIFNFLYVIVLACLCWLVGYLFIYLFIFVYLTLNRVIWEVGNSNEKMSSSD